MAASEKYYHKMPPCPLYDTEGIESWLEDLSQEGLTLQAERLFFGFLSFVPGPSQSVRYRMEPALKQQSFWSGDPTCPPEDAIALHEEFGWEFVIRLGEFYLYRSYDPNARELSTDPQIQELTLKRLSRRQWTALFFFLLHLGIQIAFGALGFPVTVFVALGFFVTICTLFLLIYFLLEPLLFMIRMSKLLRRIRSGESIHQKKDWRKTKWRYYAMKILFALASIGFFVGLFAVWIRNNSPIPLSEYAEPLPFVTLEDLAGEGSYTPKKFSGFNEVTVWEGLLLPVTYDFSQFGTLTTADGTEMSAHLMITYHEAASPWMARQMMKEYLRYADKGKYFDQVTGIAAGEVTVYSYLNRYGLQTLIFQHGAIVMEVYLTVYDDDGTYKDLWIQKMAERLLEQG